MTLTFGSLFAGIGGFDLGFTKAGMQGLWQVEIDQKCQGVLSMHFPDAERFSDVRECGRHNLKPVDVICGGFPCQDVSLAGKRAGLEGERSTLWKEFARIICELKPRWVVIENVIGLFSSDDGRFFAEILKDLAEGGYDAEWETIPALFFGAPHRRERVFIVAHPNGERCDNSSKRFCQIRFFSGLSPQPLWARTSEPPICRVDDGIPEWLDANKQLGNAVVVPVVEWIARRIVEASC